MAINERIDLKTKFTLSKRLVEINRRISELMELVENDPSPMLDKVLRIELEGRDRLLKELNETNYPKETEMKNIKIPTSLDIKKKFLTDQMDKYLPWWATTEIEAIQEAVTRKSYDHLPSYGEDDSWPLMKE